MGPPKEELTAEGFDLTFGTNVIGTFDPRTLSLRLQLSDLLATGPWYFTKLLIPALIAGKETSPDHHTRIVNTSSSGAYLTTIHWNTLTDTPARKKADTGMVLYPQSKFVRLQFDCL